MDSEDMLARLVAQADGKPADFVTLRAIVEEASELGAERALTRLHLADDAARADMAELRQLLSAWREAKRGLWRAIVGWVAKAVLALILLGLAVRFGLSDLVT